MTPTEQEIAFFIDHQEELPEWEPRLGNWCTPKDPAEPGHGLPFLIGSKSRRFYRLVSSEGTQRWALLAKHLKEDFILLPRQGQLREMLEERGYDIKTYTLVLDQSEYKTKASVWPKTGDVIDTFGPTPSIALGRALIEVMGDENNPSIPQKDKLHAE